LADTVLQVEDLCKEYRTRKGCVVANDHISFSVDRGDIVAFLGPNGSGKTTLIKQIIGYTTPTSGRITLFGETVCGAGGLSKIGYMMQSRFAHWDHLTAWDALFYTGRLKKMPKAEILAHIASLAAQLHLEQDLRVVMETMSGGKKQAVALACAVIGSPELIILDEPTNALDPEMRQYFWHFLKQTAAATGATVLLVTHSIGEIESIACEVKIFASAKIIREGSPRSLIKELNRQIRVELLLKDAEGETGADFLAGYEKKWSEDRRTLFVYTGEDDIVRCIGEVFSDRSLSARVENIQMSRPNLEDVYIKAMGAKFA
jgi:ABC-2 type transport system ATP-binding protein